MSRALSPEEMQRLRDDHLAQLNLENLSDEWRWRWVVLGSDAPLARKFVAILISFFREMPEGGYRPMIEKLAALSGLQPRQIINHANDLVAKDGFFERTSGRGAGITSVYKRRIPEKTLTELANRLAEKVQSNTPFDEKKVQPTSPFEQEKVQPSAPFSEKRCNPAHKKVQPIAPSFKSIKKREESAARTDVHAAASDQRRSTTRPQGRRPVAPASYELDFEAFWRAYVDAMRAAGEKSRANSRGMSKPEAAAAWQDLDATARGNAHAFIGAYATDKGEYMRNAGRYLSERLFDGYAEEAASRQRGAEDYRVQILADVMIGRANWTQGMTDAFGGPPGTAECRAPANLISRAKALAASMQGAANA